MISPAPTKLLLFSSPVAVLVPEGCGEKHKIPQNQIAGAPLWGISSKGGPQAPFWSFQLGGYLRGEEIEIFPPLECPFAYFPGTGKVGRLLAIPF